MPTDPYSWKTAYTNNTSADLILGEAANKYGNEPTVLLVCVETDTTGGTLTLQSYNTAFAEWFDGEAIDVESGRFIYKVDTAGTAARLVASGTTNLDVKVCELTKALGGN